MEAFVVGSKPEAVFPRAMPSVVYAANGAIGRVQTYQSHAEINAVLSSYVLSTSREGSGPTREMISQCNVDNIIIVETNNITEDVSLSELNLNATSIRRISPIDKSRLVVSQVGLSDTIRKIYLSTGCVGILKSVINYGLGRPVQGIKVSNGLFGMSLCIHEKRDIETIHLIGIGLDAESGHYYDSDKKYGNDHISKDRFYINRISSTRCDIRLTSDNDEVSKVITSNRY